MRAVPLIFRFKLAWVCLALCLAITFTTWYVINQQIKVARQHAFELRVASLVRSIEVRMRRHEQILLGGAGLFDASTHVSREEWHAYIQRLQLHNNYPGILGVGFSQVITPDELNKHIASVQAEGFADYTVKPTGERKLYTSIIYLEPFSGRNLAAFGYDMMSESTRRTAMELAVNAGRTTISGKVKLKQETHGKQQAGFLMYVPIYQHGLTPQTASERWSKLKGFVYSPYRMNDLMEGILGNEFNSIFFSIYDGPSGNEKMHDSHSNIPQHPQLQLNKQIHQYGHIWRLHFASTPEFEAQFASPLGNVTLGLGISISALIFLLFISATRRQALAETMALQMTNELRLQQQQAHENHSQLQALLQGAEHIIISSDLNGVIQSFNRAAEQQLGYQASELIGKQNLLYLHLNQEIQQRIAELNQAGTPITQELEALIKLASPARNGETRDWHYVRKDGSTFPVSLTVTSIRDENGAVNAFLAIATDISDRVQASREVQNHATRLNAILDHVLDGIITIDETCTIQSFNLSAEKIFGYPAAEVIGRNVNVLMPEPFHSEHDGYLRNYMFSGVRKIIGIGREVTGRRKNASTFPMDLAVTEMVVDGQRMFTGIIRDITDRKHFDEELRKLSRALEQSPVSVLITDSRGIIEYVNNKFIELTGYSAQEAIGQKTSMLRSENTPIETYERLWKTILAGNEWRGRIQNRRKNGELFWEDTLIAPICDKQGKITNFVSVKEDVSEKVKLENMKNEFISTVSHELRTPLTAIRGSLALMGGGAVGPVSASMKTMLDIALRNSERLMLLVNDLLDIEKIEAGKMDFDFRLINLGPVLKQVIENNREYASQFRVQYSLQPVPADILIQVDENRLQQVLTNLLSNAAKFSPPGETVVIETIRHKQEIRIAVHNKGAGIAANFRDQVFKKFVQADSSDTRKKGGTGLGLAISKAIIEQMRGKIGFESEPQVLTTFYIDLPLWQSDI